MEPYLQPPRVMFRPGREYSDETRKFQGIPTLERTPLDRFWAAWYGGGITEDRYNYIMLATCANKEWDWSGVTTVIEPDGDGPVRASDPCLWHDPNERLWLFWSQGNENHTDERAGVWSMHTDQPENEAPAWSDPLRLCDGVMMNKPTVLSSGEWLLPVSRWYQEGSAGVYTSTNEGSAWRLLGKANVPDEAERSADEHSIVELSDGRLLMFVRTKYGIGESISMDRGTTWEPVKPSAIQHPTSRFFLRTLRSGNLLLVKHGPMAVRTHRSQLTAYLSNDDGQTWQGGLVLDERLGVSYPDGVQSPSGIIYLIYDFMRKGEKEILMAIFTEEDVLGDGSNAELRILINKARGYNPNDSPVS